MYNETFLIRDLGKKLSEFTKDEFIKIVIEDVEAAKAPYRKWSDENAKTRYERDYEYFQKKREEQIQRIINKSHLKYKRKSNRQKWVDAEIAKLPTELERKYYHNGYDLRSIRCDFEPWSNGGVRYVGLDEDLERAFGRLYDEFIDNKYFFNCTGWRFICDNIIDTPNFRLQLSDELQAEWDADLKRLSDDIARFYADCRYCGD